ncbi:MAG: formylglycine-generating enzyme family protein [Hyphomonadaceae bacterium]|nr:formylglycine-generating enzyme family protein [Hyphomonadaceae bacterium]
MSRLLKCEPVIRAAGHADCKGDHAIAARRFIMGAHFGVVFLEPAGFRSEPGDPWPCFQFIEMKAMWERASKAERTRKPFLGIPVILDHAAAGSVTRYFDRLIAEAAAHNDADPIKWWSDQSCLILRDYRNLGSEQFVEGLKLIVGRIEEHMDTIRGVVEDAPPLNISQACVAPNQPQDATTKDGIEDLAAAMQAFAELERDYLQSAIENWCRARIADGVTLSDSAFRFQPSRFVEFTASQHARDGSRDVSIERHPLSHWLFKTQSLPLLLVGEGGAGKTTALTAAACAFAAGIDPGLKQFGKQIAHGQWLETAAASLSGNDAPAYMPVVMRCVDAVASIGDQTIDSDALIAAVLAHMRKVAEQEADAQPGKRERDQFVARLKRQPYVLMLDGLDELADPDKRHQLFLGANNLVRRLHQSHFRVMVTTRGGYEPKSDDVTRVVLDEPLASWEHIETFIRRFTSKRQEQEKLLAAARAVRALGDGRNAPLRTPLLLSAFCCIALEHADPATRLSQFCERTVDYLLHGRNFSALGAAQLRSAEKTEEIARRILRKFAHAFVTNRRGEIRLGEDAVGAWLRREAAGLGLSPLDLPAAKAIVRELAAQSNLFRLEGDNTYAFDNNAMFWEYLAGEEIAATGRSGEFAAAQRIEAPAWCSALKFAHAINIDSAPEGQALDAPVTLLQLAASNSDAARAFTVAHFALGMLGEAVPADDIDGEIASELRAVLRSAVDVYRKWHKDWRASTRATYCDTFYRIGRRNNAERTALAVDQMLEMMLAPRRRWIEVNSSDLPAGFMVADAPVLVSEYRRFVDDPAAHEDRWWPNARPTRAEQNPRLLIDDPSDLHAAAVKRRDGWVEQMERPGSPVVSVSFYEAVAYALWFDQRSRAAPEGLQQHEVIRLPTELEWAALLRWAAKGAHYPWGEVSLEDNPERINWLRADIDHPSSPGVFDPIGAEGLYDLGSNVSCWTIPVDATSIWPPDLTGRAAMSGGSWLEFKQDVFAVGSEPNLEMPTYRQSGLGFRLVRAPRLK